MKKVDKKQRTKLISIENESFAQISVLCKILHTNFSHKATELIVEWKIKKIAELKRCSPDEFKKFEEMVLEELKKNSSC